MNTFMATAKFRVEHYMDDEEHSTQLQNFTISASSETEAEIKVYAYFNDKSEPYDTMYHVLDVTVWTHLE